MKKPSAKPDFPTPRHAFLAALIAGVVLFGLTQFFLFGILALAALAGVLYFEFRDVNDARELLFSAAIALGAWLLLSLVLNTASPINIITSCSMLPGFERGDLIFLQGGTPNAPIIQISFPLANTETRPAQITQNGQIVARIFQPYANQEALFEPQIATCQRQSAAGNQSQVCLSGIRIQNQDVPVLASPDVAVFDSNTSAGLIIHRVFAVLNATDGEYMLTKGDNNNFLDQQGGFNLIPLKRADRVLLNVPALGILS
ncbi:MAG: S26 family signal peptidase, partial [Candidatus Micrarchaeota archaeon]|nr:S26 family signal peptidase [Candidatus Micrarchaeota archaeon]